MPLTVALTSTVPTACAGETTVQVVLEEHWTEPARVDPKLNSVALPISAKPLPVTTRLEPPACGPLLGVNLLTVGAAYLYRSAAETALVPPLGIDSS